MTAWKPNGLRYQSTLIIDTCNFMNYTASSFHRKDGTDLEKGWVGEYHGSCHATGSPGAGSGVLFHSLCSPRLERCSQILVKGCGASLPTAFFRNTQLLQYSYVSLSLGPGRKCLDDTKADLNGCFLSHHHGLYARGHFCTSWWSASCLSVYTLEDTKLFCGLG